MAFPLILELVLVVSIAGIIALSLFILYLLDKVQTRVNSLEHILNDIKAIKDEVSVLLAEKDQSKRSGQVQSGSESGIVAIPNGRAKEVSPIEKLESSLRASIEKLEAFGDQVRNNGSRTNELTSDLLRTNKAMDGLSNKVSETDDTLVVLQRDLSRLSRKLNELEDTITTLIRQSLQSKA